MIFNEYSHEKLFVLVWSLQSWLCQYVKPEGDGLVFISEARQQ